MVAEFTGVQLSTLQRQAFFHLKDCCALQDQSYCTVSIDAAINLIAVLFGSTTT
jgi:hypothetical protein